jgi:hypothetical protein
MCPETLETATFIPEDPEELAPVVGFLATHERLRGTAASPNYALVGVDEHDRIELPQSVHQALTRVVAALHAGKAVTIAPQTMKLTTQQAAERIGNRHRLQLDDVLAYRDERRTRQYEALATTTVDIDSADDPETIRQQLREARRVVAERRRTKTAAH